MFAVCLCVCLCRMGLVGCTGMSRYKDLWLRGWDSAFLVSVMSLAQNDDKLLLICNSKDIFPLKSSGLFLKCGYYPKPFILVICLTVPLFFFTPNTQHSVEIVICCISHSHEFQTTQEGDGSIEEYFSTEFNGCWSISIKSNRQ